ncbi:MAG TPA: HAD family hydrolase [Clostridiales bacterium]|nr:HAD family hydrolase [Clostridiales bacterium]
MTKQNYNLIFDMDGTLVDSAFVSVEACQEMARRWGLPVRTADEISGLVGYADEDFYSRLYPQFSKEERLEFAAQVENMENEAIIGMGSKLLYSGVVDLLQELERKGYYLAIASTRTKGHVDAALHESGIVKYFSQIRCGAPDKQDMVRELMQQGPKGQWLILGDRHKDLEAGRANGIVTVAARYGCGNPEEYAQFDYGIDQPLELLPLLDTLQ